MSQHIPYGDDDLKNQIEIVDGDEELLDNNGRLKKCGWSRNPNLKYNPGVLSRFIRSFRLKEWNYYSIGSDSFYFAVAAVDLGYLCNYHTFYIDYNDNSQTLHHEVITMTPFSKIISLPSCSHQLGNHVDYKNKNIEIQFTVTNENNRIYHNIIIKSNNKKDKVDGNFKYDLTKDRESMVLATPIGKTNFYFNQKTNLIPVTGSLKINGVEKLTETCRFYGIMDWGRGVWDYSSFWLWSTSWGTAKLLSVNHSNIDENATSSSTSQNVTIGLNFGSGFGNLSTHTENAINIDGKLHKLGHVDIQYNEKNLLEPWKFVCKHGRFGEQPLIFTPIQNKYENNNFGLVMSSFHQIIGKFTGEVILDSGERVVMDNVYGFNEVHRARW